MEVNLTNLEISATLSNEYVLNATIDKGGYSENEDSVAAGKAMVAAAISNKGVPTDDIVSFNQMAKNIDKIKTSDEPSGSYINELIIDNIIYSTNTITGYGEVTE